MAERDVFGWLTTASLNNFPAADGGWPEGMKRSDVNDANRINLGAVRRWYEDPEFLNLARSATDGTALTVSKVSANLLRVAGRNITSVTNADRRVELQISGVFSQFAHIVSAIFTASSTRLTTPPPRRSNSPSVMAAWCSRAACRHG